jgi:hypothetical protein
MFCSGHESSPEESARQAQAYLVSICFDFFPGPKEKWLLAAGNVFAEHPGAAALHFLALKYGPNQAVELAINDQIFFLAVVSGRHHAHHALVIGAKAGGSGNGNGK